MASRPCDRADVWLSARQVRANRRLQRAVESPAARQPHRPAGGRVQPGWAGRQPQGATERASSATGCGASADYGRVSARVGRMSAASVQRQRRAGSRGRAGAVAVGDASRAGGCGVTGWGVRHAGTGSAESGRRTRIACPPRIVGVSRRCLPKVGYDGGGQRPQRRGRCDRSGGSLRACCPPTPTPRALTSSRKPGRGRSAGAGGRREAPCRLWWRGPARVRVR